MLWLVGRPGLQPAGMCSIKLGQLMHRACCARCAGRCARPKPALRVPLHLQGGIDAACSLLCPLRRRLCTTWTSASRAWAAKSPLERLD